MSPRQTRLWSCVIALCALVTHAGAGPPPNRLEKFTTRRSLTAMAATSAGLYYVVLQGKPLGATMMRWAPRMTMARLAEPGLSGTRFRVSNGQLVYVRRTDTDTCLVIRDPGLPPSDYPVQGAAVDSVRFCFPDGDNYLLSGRVGSPPAADAPERLFVYSLATQQLSAVPVPSTSMPASVFGVIDSTRAIVACGADFAISTFAGSVHHAVRQDVNGRLLEPLNSVLPFDAGEDRYLGPLLMMAGKGGRSEFQALCLGPPKLRLPPPAEMRAAFHRPDRDLLLVQQGKGSTVSRDLIARPGQGRLASMPASGLLTGLPVYWEARELLLWRERGSGTVDGHSSELIVYDTRQLRPLARIRMAGSPRPLPGSCAGSAFLLAVDGTAGADLYWFDLERDGVTVNLRPAAAAIGGQPLACFSAAGQSVCYVVVERSDGPELDLLALKP